MTSPRIGAERGRGPKSLDAPASGILLIAVVGSAPSGTVWDFR